VVNLNENKNYLKNYDFISEDVKFAANSIIRLKILACLYEKPQNIKDLADSTRLSYSSISSTVHGLELKDFVYRESNRYYLSNSIGVIMKTVLELKEVVNLLEKFFNIVDGHVVDRIPDKSVTELHLLEKADLLESGGMNPYKIYDFIENTLSHANEIYCILPFYHLNINKKLNDLVRKEKYVEVMVSDEVFEIYEDKSDVKFLSSFKGENNFLLIVSDEVMILGFFKSDGSFDQNRLLTSKDKESLIWAKNSFKYFKKKNK
jgi:predicted transcriptional regulator